MICPNPLLFIHTLDKESIIVIIEKIFMHLITLVFMQTTYIITGVISPMNYSFIFWRGICYSRMICIPNSVCLYPVFPN
ncbi:hypothetical protein L873DRAFT_1302990 [Choiromyces venosus 120613-1]|uniref:Uncharacterized protein n=1 Tax=Choiromyces venosus 120613-1 TaxID=1336337 RepID=A0A3N4JFB6_9PEZI|nr:hypothetical protein L873DRAFT_1302990 [Choiromyces venosus 120613-1]